jgi:hypothetical protein
MHPERRGGAAAMPYMAPDSCGYDTLGNTVRPKPIARW